MTPRGTLRRRWVAVDGVRIHLREGVPAQGTLDRPTIVLVHGFVISSRYMRPLARVLTRHGWRVLAPDLPGFGRSEHAGGVPDMAGLAAWLGRILDAAGVTGPAHVLGNSMGCQVAVRLAIQEPERARSLLLVGPTFDPSAGLGRHLLRLLAVMPRERLRLWAEHIPDYLHAGPRRILATLEHARAHDIERDLPGVPHPLLVVRGSDDAIAPPAWTRAVASLAPCGRAVTLPGAAHAPNYSDAEALARLVEPFLEANSPGAQRE